MSSNPQDLYNEEYISLALSALPEHKAPAHNPLSKMGLDSVTNSGASKE